MLEFFANNPFFALVLCLLFNPPGLLSVVGLFWLARRYDIRSPFKPRGGGEV
jgi:hypothetical protein